MWVESNVSSPIHTHNPGNEFARVCQVPSGKLGPNSRKIQRKPCVNSYYFANKQLPNALVRDGAGHGREIEGTFSREHGQSHGCRFLPGKNLLGQAGGLRPENEVVAWGEFGIEEADAPSGGKKPSARTRSRGDIGGPVCVLEQRQPRPVVKPGAAAGFF